MTACGTGLVLLIWLACESATEKVKSVPAASMADEMQPKRGLQSIGGWQSTGTNT